MSDLNNLWQRLKEKLTKAVEENDFSFLEVLRLSPKKARAFPKVLKFAVGPTQADTFPQMSGLFHHMKITLGHKQWDLTNLKKAGLVVNRQPGKDVWELTPLGFRGLEEISPEILHGYLQKGNGRKTAGRKKANSDPELTGKTKQVWDFLQSERVGDELDLTAEQRKKLAQAMDSSMSYVLQVLKMLEEKGLLRRIKSKGSHGKQTLIFTKKEKEAAPHTETPRSPNGASLSGRLEAEIKGLEAAKVSLSGKIAAIQSQIEKKTIALEEVRRLEGK